MEKTEYEKYEKVNHKMIKLNIREGMAGRWFRVALTTFSSIGPMLIYLAGVQSMGSERVGKTEQLSKHTAHCI